jgi:hypothetical protein
LETWKFEGTHPIYIYMYITGDTFLAFWGYYGLLFYLSVMYSQLIGDVNDHNLAENLGDCALTARK